MKGEVIIDAKGEITSSLALENQELKELGDIITGMLQDINSYIRSTNGEAGDLKKTTLRVGNHEINIVVSTEVVKASVKEIFAS